MFNLCKLAYFVLKLKERPDKATQKSQLTTMNKILYHNLFRWTVYKKVLIFIIRYSFCKYFNNKSSIF